MSAGAGVPRTPRLQRRDWVPSDSEARVAEIAERTSALEPVDVLRWIEALTVENRRIHESQSINLNPASNAMNPRAEALLAAGLGTRPSLGYPGAKYETGLEAIEQIEVITAELAAEVFDAGFAEIRVPSGASANLFAFMAAARPGDAVIVPPPEIAGHVTHNRDGAAGLYGLDVHEAPIDAERYTVDVDRLGEMAERVRPRVISLGGSLNLFEHPVAEVRRVADGVGATVLFDAAHLSGPIAGGAWPNPLHEGAHVMTMSTYKSLAGPPGGLLVTDDAALAARVDAIAFPGLTANFDVATSAALAVTLLDWQCAGSAYATAMTDAARVLAAELGRSGVEVYAARLGGTRSHAFAIDARPHGGGADLAQRLRRGNLLTSAIGVPGDLDGGLRIGTNEITRFGATEAQMPELASLLAEAVASDPAQVATRATAWRASLPGLRFIID